MDSSKQTRLDLNCLKVGLERELSVLASGGVRLNERGALRKGEVLFAQIILLFDHGGEEKTD